MTLGGDMNCYCGSVIEQERKLLGLSICLTCAKRTQPQKVVGYMMYSHKTAPTLCLTTQEAFANYRRDTDRKGQSSILRSKMSGNGRLM